MGLSKPQMLKKTDPYGLGITVLSMGIVFSCLALLFLFFWLFGTYMERKQRTAKSTAKHGGMVTEECDDPTQKDIDMAACMAVISLALREHLEDAHDIEPGIITIKSKQTRWNAPRS